MSREVIQDFLNLAGVVGIALTNRRMRPYFYGLDTVSDRTKQALGQGVLQVIENVPDGFESFEFNFAGHIVFIYKLTHGLVLLVLTDSSLKLVDYRRGITKIKNLIETDTYNTVAYFKLLLGSVTQHSLPSKNWAANNSQPTTQTTFQDKPATHRFAINVEPDVNVMPANKVTSEPRQQTSNQTNSFSSSNASTNVQIQPNTNKPQTPPSSPSPSPVSVTTTTTVVAKSPPKVADNQTNSVSGKTGTEEYKLDELLAALNKLSSFTTQYLGKVVVTNYWKSSRPDSSWLAEFEVDRSGQMSHPKQQAIVCTAEQHQQLQVWVTAYIKRCKQVIRNFDQMLKQDCLDDRQKQILLSGL